MRRIATDSNVCVPRAVRKILDLSEVTLVDIEMVRFLIQCENEGVELVQCPPYVREWILRERAEGPQDGSADAG